MSNIWLVPAVMSVFGALQGYEAGREMDNLADERERLAERNALLARRDLAEKVRRQAEEDYRLRSAALARAAATGVRVSGSVADYLEYMEDEQARQLRWLRTSGASRIRLELEGAKRDADSLRIRASSQRWGSLVGGFTRAFDFLDRGGYFTDDTKVWEPAITGPK